MEFTDLVTLFEGKKEITLNDVIPFMKPVIRTGSAKTTLEDIEKCRKFLLNYNASWIPEIDKIKSSNISLTDLCIQVQKGSILITDALYTLTPCIIVTSVLTHLKYLYMDIDELFIMVMDDFKKKLVTNKSNAPGNFVTSGIKQKMARTTIEKIYQYRLVHEDDNNYQKVYVLNDIFFDSDFIVKTLFERLTEKEIFVIKQRFGLEDDICHGLEEVGKTLRVTIERIRQIERKAIRKMRRNALRYNLYEFLEKTEYATTYSSDISRGVIFSDLSNLDCLFSKYKLEDIEDVDALSEEEYAEEETIDEEEDVLFNEPQNSWEKLVNSELNNTRLKFIVNNIGISEKSMYHPVHRWSLHDALKLLQYIDTVPVIEACDTFTEHYGLNTSAKLMGTCNMFAKLLSNYEAVMLFLEHHEPEEEDGIIKLYEICKTMYE